ncbi:MAG: Gfo/Idh/MocA family oxidoreductase [Armatimonadetes bacterium]|nr:Gfo/Idh/MocA family oxidoreductase [Armatimonadota bacterium]
MNRRDFVKSSAATVALTKAFSIIPQRAFGANDRLSIGLIGIGGRGSGMLQDMYDAGRVHNAEITAVCDTWNQRRETAAQMVNALYDAECREFADYEALLALDDVDVVGVATPDFAHGPIMIDALKAGKDVFVEKPMANTVQEANAALDLAQKNRRVVQVGTQRRSDGRWRGAAKMIQDGVLGKVSRIELAWNDNRPRWLRGEIALSEPDVHWRRYLMGKKMRAFDAHQYVEWHLYRDFCNGPIALLGAHYLDVAAWFMDDPYPSAAVAAGGKYVWTDREHEDTVTALLEYPKGFLVSYTTALGNGDGAKPVCRFYGESGVFDEAPFTFTGQGGVAGRALKEALTVTPLEGEPHQHNFLRCVRSRQTPSAPIQAGHQHTVACVLAYTALRRGKRMRYLPQQRQIVEA